MAALMGQMMQMPLMISSLIKHAAVCGEAATCPLFSTLEAWANQSVPLDLSITPEPPKSAKGKSK